MDVSADKLHEGDSGTIIDIVDVKVEPELVGSLRLKEGIFPAYHMNKEHWITIKLDNNFREGAI